MKADEKEPNLRKMKAAALAKYASKSKEEEDEVEEEEDKSGKDLDEMIPGKKKAIAILKAKAKK
jgi:hypothetical protein